MITNLRYQELPEIPDPMDPPAISGRRENAGKLDVRVTREVTDVSEAPASKEIEAAMGLAERERRANAAKPDQPVELATKDVPEVRAPPAKPEGPAKSDPRGPGVPSTSA